MPGRQSAFPRDGGRQISFPTVVLRPHGSPGIVESQREPPKWDSGWFFSLEGGGEAGESGTARNLGTLAGVALRLFDAAAKVMKQARLVSPA